MRHFWGFVCFLLLSAANVFSQAHTVGVISANPGMAEGYSLIASNNSFSTFLIDNCGREINSWTQSSYVPGSAVYLLEDGSLMRTCRFPNANFNLGGLGGRLERYSWEDSLVWSWNHSFANRTLHHDIEPLPNGNFLVLGLEVKDNLEMLLAGRDPSLMTDNVLWTEYILEIEPIGSDSANIVWEWHAWDHVIQDYDNSRANFGIIQDHPERIDLNYTNSPATKDWIHANALSYNAHLDEIIITLAHFDEFWIIDHSTNTAQAAGHSGGNRGKGGDLLYRWGNPRAYARGDSADQTLFFMHNAHWIPDDRPDSGKVLVFNNGQGRRYSSVEIIDLPEISPGEYQLTSGQAYGPLNSEWTYTSDTLYDFFSKIMSGAQQQKNGNILIASGAYGYAFEVDKSRNLYWHYVSPIFQNTALSQGATVPLGVNSVFRFERYSHDFSGFLGRNLSPGDPLEANFDIQDCLNVLTTIEEENPQLELPQIFPNPSTSSLTIIANSAFGEDFVLSNLQGQILHKGTLTQTMILDVSEWSPGIYILNIAGIPSKKIVVITP